jgi:predicted DNA-binding transcriptional regulator YafY
VTAAGPDADATPEERRALFRVVRGEPSPEELAALTVVLAAAAAAGGDEPPAPARDAWSDPARQVRTALTAGRGAWQRTFWPR